MRALRADYPEFRIASTQGAIHSTPIEDFYIVPSEFSDGGQAVLRVLINPMGVVDVGLRPAADTWDGVRAIAAP